MVSPDGFLRLEERYGALEMKRQELIWELCRTEFGYSEWLDIVPGSIIDLFENLEESASYIKMCESILDNQDIHHIPSQLLILDDHQAATEDDHLVILKISETFQNFIDHLAGQQLWKSTDETIRELEQVKMREEELETLKLIESQITGLAENFKLADGKRKLVRQGFVLPQPKMTLNPKLSLKSIDSKLDSLSTHHHHHQSGKQRKGSFQIRLMTIKN
ncbi:hypothetical protein KEM48_010792 [Puccinia striiformis f. sp. tritici PST-130]|nr:hypothetical protein KEM48_010792 [Puccinia striiformis f. sp. tritici PST-130]